MASELQPDCNQRLCEEFIRIIADLLSFVIKSSFHGEERELTISICFNFVIFRILGKEMHLEIGIVVIYKKTGQ